MLQVSLHRHSIHAPHLWACIHRVELRETPEQARPEPASAQQHFLHEQRIDAELDQSFPASDPPSWTLGKPKSVVRAAASVSHRSRNRSRRGTT